MNQDNNSDRINNGSNNRDADRAGDRESRSQTLFIFPQNGDDPSLFINYTFSFPNGAFPRVNLNTDNGGNNERATSENSESENGNATAENNNNDAGDGNRLNFHWQNGAFTFTAPFDIRIPEFKPRASDRAIAGLKRVDLNSVPESDRNCPICFDPYTEGEEKDETKDDKKVDDRNPQDRPLQRVEGQEEDVVMSDDPPESVPEDMVPEEDPAESVPQEQSMDEPLKLEGHSPIEMPCGHRFGASCIKEWLASSTTCPLCRSPIESQDDYLRSTGQEPENGGLNNILELISSFLPQVAMSVFGPNQQGVGQAGEGDAQGDVNRNASANDNGNSGADANTNLNANSNNETNEGGNNSNNFLSIPQIMSRVTNMLLARGHGTNSRTDNANPNNNNDNDNNNNNNNNENNNNNNDNGDNSNDNNAVNLGQAPSNPAPADENGIRYGAVPIFYRTFVLDTSGNQNQDNRQANQANNNVVGGSNAISTGDTASRPGGAGGNNYAVSVHYPPLTEGGRSNSNTPIDNARTPLMVFSRRRLRPVTSGPGPVRSSPATSVPPSSISAALRRNRAATSSSMSPSSSSSPSAVTTEDVRHHPYRTRSNNRTMFSDDVADANETQCTSSTRSCMTRDDGEGPVSQTVRLECGHAYHEACLRTHMRAHGDTEIPDLSPRLDQEDSREVWCAACRRYRKLNG